MDDAIGTFFDSFIYPTIYVFISQFFGIVYFTNDICDFIIVSINEVNKVFFHQTRYFFVLNASFCVIRVISLRRIREVLETSSDRRVEVIIGHFLSLQTIIYEKLAYLF